MTVAEGVRLSEHVSDTCWFVKKPGEKTIVDYAPMGSNRVEISRIDLIGSTNDGEEDPRVLVRDADQETLNENKKNALRTVPRQAVERATSKWGYHTGLGTETINFII
ncbi:hypothetical protein TNCV_3375551 [Trichonephila clavipes]|nr:hypothetical protein TNCV_3375551 [Trichonephila clavipes]